MAKNKLEAKITQTSPVSGATAVIMDLAEVLPEKELEVAMDAIMTGKQIPPEIKSKINAALIKSQMARDNVEPEVSEAIKFGTSGIANKTYEASPIILTPDQLLTQQMMQILQFYWGVQQPCLVVGRNGSGFTVMNQNLTYDRIMRAANDESMDYVYFTDGIRMTKLR